MRYRIFGFALFLLFITKGYALPVQYEQLRIAKINVVSKNTSSTSSFDKRSVLARMETKVGGVFSQYEFDSDLKALAEVYDRVEPIIEEKNGELYITLAIWCKPTIRQITFCGNEKIRTKKLIKELDIKIGEIFEREAFIQAFNKLKALYIKKGFFQAEFDFCIEEVCEGEQIDIQILISEGRAGKVKRIDFCGLTHTEEVELLQIIATKRYRFLFSWITGAGVYHDDMIEHDRMMILNYYQNEGFADAKVNICISEECEEDKIIIVISIERGICYQFGTISFSGNCVYTNDDIWGAIPFRQGMPFSPEMLRMAISDIQDLYGSCGYIDAAVDTKLTLHEGCPTYDLSITIEEGEQYRVGLIKVFGNQCTQTRVILHESLLCPGEIFDMRKLEGTERRLTNTNYFKAVNVYPVRSADTYGCEANFRDIFIEVEETDTGNVSLFGGFSTLDRIFGGIEISECNFNSRGLLNLIKCGPRALRGGGEYLHMKANFGDKQTCYMLQWTKPYFMDTPWILGFDIEKTNNRVLSHAYEIKSYGGHVHATYIVNSYLKYAWHYRANHTRNNLPGHPNPTLNKEGRIAGFVSAFGLGIHYDSTDHPRKPTRGLRSRLTGEVAGAGGNFQFLKLGYFNNLYYPLWPRGVMKFRFETEFIQPFGHTTPKTLPLGERLYMGGDTTVRGYRPFIIGPIYSTNEPRGGVSSLLVSEEYQHHLFSCVDAFIFADAGYLSLSEFTIGKLQSSYGFGFRVEVMRNLPFTIGVGFPYKAKEDRTQRFFFAMGGSF